MSGMKLTRNGMTRIGIREQGGARGAFQAELAAQGITVTVETVITTSKVTTRETAELVGEVALVRSRAMHGDGELLQAATSYIPIALAEGTAIMEQDPGPGGTFSVLAATGHEPVSFAETIECGCPDQNEMVIFPDSSCLYRIRRIARDASRGTALGMVVDVTDMILPAEKWKLVYEWGK